MRMCLSSRKHKSEFAFLPLTVLLSTCHILGMILRVAARKMESVASFFIHDGSDGPAIAHVAVKTAAHTV